nr:4632_t:CDS:2 [Entrophospora candida]
MACKTQISYDFAYSNKIVNTKKCVKQHLRSCENFFAKYGQEILDNTDSETTKARQTKNLQKRNQNNNNENIQLNNGDNSINSLTDTSSSPFSSNVNISTNFGTLDQYVIHNLNGNKQQQWWYLLLKATISNGWSFRWVENKDSLELFSFLNPNLQLPTRKQLGGTILTNASTDIIQTIENKAKSDEIGVSLVLDGWVNVVNQNLLGSVLVTSKGEVLVWRAQDVTTVVTDSASQYAAAHRSLQILHPEIVYLPCFSHQVNLCVGDIFKESDNFDVVANNACKIATYFT